MMVKCNATAVIEYDRRRSGLPSAPLLDKEYGNNITEEYPPKLHPYSRTCPLGRCMGAWCSSSVYSSAFG